MGSVFFAVIKSSAPEAKKACSQLQRPEH